MSEPGDPLRGAGIEFRPDRPLPFVLVEVDTRGYPVAPGEQVKVAQGEQETEVSLPGVRDLLAAEAPPAPPPPEEGPADPLAAYELLFAALESAVADYCSTTGRRERDREIQRVYRRLRDKPDGRDRNPLFGHLRAVLRVYMALAPVPAEDFEAVLERLVTSVRRMAQGGDSTHYLTKLTSALEELATQAEAEAAGGEGAAEAGPPAPGEVGEAAPEATP